MSNMKQMKIVQFAKTVLLAEDSTQSTNGFPVTGLQSPAVYSDLLISKEGTGSDNSSNSESCVSVPPIVTNIEDADGMIYIRSLIGGMAAIRTDLHWQIYFVNKRKHMSFLMSLPSAAKAESVKMVLLTTLEKYGKL